MMCKRNILRFLARGFVLNVMRKKTIGGFSSRVD